MPSPSSDGFTCSLRTGLLYRGSRVRATTAQLRAADTRRFCRVLSRHPRPVPPIHQPGAVTARAAPHRRGRPDAT
ncbi:hypothetical protein ACFYWA_24980 [Streptomyces sp. NPDC003283]|uniref:hypothetical protein n=1 Tax=Streptomyces sp. NPDC003283 TaxID=3364681 RepID=UPI00367A6FD7